jgi:hypothetical protein
VLYGAGNNSYIELVDDKKSFESMLNFVIQKGKLLLISRGKMLYVDLPCRLPDEPLGSYCQRQFRHLFRLVN